MAIVCCIGMTFAEVARRAARNHFDIVEFSWGGSLWGGFCAAIDSSHAVIGETKGVPVAWALTNGDKRLISEGLCPAH